MLALGRHAHHAIIGKTCTPCYHWKDMHTMLALGRHAHHAIIGKTCTPCYHWEDMHIMLSLGRHAHHAIIGKTCTSCYHWEDLHTMLSLECVLPCKMAPENASYIRLLALVIVLSMQELNYKIMEPFRKKNFPSNTWNRFHEKAWYFKISYSLIVSVEVRNVLYTTH